MEQATEYSILPGDGIFFPYTAPHMVENGSEEYSISFSVTHMTENDYNVRCINKINQLIRKRGASPRDLGHSAVADQAKLMIHFVLRKVLAPFQVHWRNP
jgi:hypothetical protein